MHLGSLKSLGKYGDKNLKYVLLNNNSHDSVGGQKTFVDEINFNQLSKSIGFKKFYLIKERKTINQVLNSFLKTNKSSFLEVRIKQASNKKLPRPENLKNIKKEFMSA